MRKCLIVEMLKSIYSNAMGLLLDILGAPLLGPVKGVKWVAEKIAEVADQKVTDRSKQQAELIEAQMLLEMGEIDEEEFKRREDAILKRVDAGEKKKK